MAIRSVNDPGGFGRLAQTVLRNRAIDQERQAREGQLQTDRDLAKGFAANTGNVGIPFAPLPQQDANLVAETPGGTLADLAQIQNLRSSAGGTKKVPFQKGTNTLVSQGGETFLSTPVFNANTGTVENVLTPVSGDVLSRLGQTPEQRIVTDVDKAGQSEAAKLAAQLETKPQITREQEAQKQQVSNLNQVVKDAKESASGIATVRRAMGLLDVVETGGVDKASILAKQFFGIESGDEGELNSLLAQSVLQDLKKTFGAAFTEREGARLESIRAGIGRNAATNKRLLQQALDLAIEDSRRGIAAAQELGSDFDANDIQRLMDFQFTPPAPSAADTNRARFEAEKAKRTGQPLAEVVQEPIQAAEPAITSQAEFDALPPGAFFIEDGQRFQKPGVQ